MSTSKSFPYVLFSEPLHVSCSVCVGRLRLGVTAFSILVTILVLYPSLKMFFKSFITKGGARLIWRKDYPSFEDIHALFDRGDALMAAVDVATTLQLAHEEVAKVLDAHSYMKANAMRRLVRTLTFIRITVRSNAEERSQVVSWLHQLHRPIKLFEFKTNVFILATIAYGLGRAHQVLGGVTDYEVDALVSTIMNMAKILTPYEEGQDRTVPTTLREVTDYLSKQVKFAPSDLREFSTMDGYVMESLGAPIRKKGGRPFGGALRPKLQASMLFQPLSWLKFYIFVHLIRDLSNGIFASGSPDFRPGMVLWVFQKLQPVFCQFHYSLCPGFLTFDGLFELFSEREPSLRMASDEVYGEIFGVENAAKTKCRQSQDKNMSAHLPHLGNEDEMAPPLATIPSPSVYSEVMEHLKCAYLRGQLQGHSVPQHLGVIMDGNRRFSKQNHLGGPLEGHEKGARKLLECMSWSFSSGVRNLTVWALSDDNLKRGMGELDPLFAMMADYIQEIFMGNTPISVLDIRFRVVGDRSILPEKLCKIIDAAERATRHNSRFNLQLALGYGGRAETTRAMKRALEFQAREKGLSMEEAVSSLTPSDVSKHTYSAELGLPEMDAILRTSGEKRLSGFALWETHGAEISFVGAHWPALKESDFLQSIVDLSGRNRRFGA
ncbi:unnamed protein product [Calypogeia fissa]